MSSPRLRLLAAGLIAVALLATTATIAPTALAQDDERTHEEKREERLAKLQERLDTAVEDGRITPERADEIRTRIEEGIARADARRAEKQANAEALAEVLGTTIDGLREARKAGQSLADIAAANGVAVDEVIGHLTAQAMERLNQAVDNDRIDAARAAELEATLQERITARVNGEVPERERPDRDRPRRGGRFGPGRFGPPGDG